MQDLLVKYKYFIIGGIGVLAIVIFQLWNHQTPEPPAFPIETESSEEVEPEPAIVEGGEIVVDVKGAVRERGIFTLKQGQRVNDAIIMAGGFAENADERHVNLAQLLEDEMVIYVPHKQEEGFENFQITQPESQSQGDTININTATSQELQGLSGVGPARAEAIVQYREENGRFQQIEDLMNVSGIGEKTFENLKEQISVQ